MNTGLWGYVCVGGGLDSACSPGPLGTLRKEHHCLPWFVDSNEKGDVQWQGPQELMQAAVWAVAARTRQGAGRKHLQV